MPDGFIVVTLVDSRTGEISQIHTRSRDIAGCSVHKENQEILCPSTGVKETSCSLNSTSSNPLIWSLCVDSGGFNLQAAVKMG